MTITSAQMAAAIEKAYTNASRLDNVVNGPDTMDVPVDSGVVPTLAKFFKGVDEDVDARVDAAVGQLSSAFAVLLNTVADGATDTYLLTSPVSSVNGHLNMNVQVGGAPQPKDGIAYTIIDSGTKIKFSEVPSAGTKLYAEGAAVFSGDAFITINGPYDFASQAEFAAATIPLALMQVKLAGYYAPGPGAHMKVRISVPGVVKPWHSQAADGSWWEIARGQDVHVDMFGAIRRTQAELVILNGHPSLAIDASTNAAAFQAANDFLEPVGGGTFYGMGNFYLIGVPGWRYSRATRFKGAGHGKWMPSFNTQTKTWEGTNLVAYGSGVRNYTAQGITSGELSGGWRTSLDTPSRKFKLTSLMNRDAVGSTAATPRAMSIFIGPKARNQDKGGIEACRIVPWIGTDGISAYNALTGSDLGADWDGGLLLDTIEGFHTVDVQIRGYWRMFGLAEISPDWEDWSRSEANIFVNTSATGFVGILLRSGDQKKVISSTTSSVTIKWEAENPWPATGGNINFPNAGYTTYASTTRVGDELTFNGIPVNVAGETYLRNPRRGTGFSTGAFINCEAWALWHHSGQKAEALGFSRPSTGFECSGFPMRGMNFFNFSAFGEDSISPAMHLHNCFDFNFVGGKAEIGIVLASSIESQQELPTTAAGFTNNLGLHGFQFTSSIDSRSGYWRPRSVRDLQRQWSPLEELTTDIFMLKALENQEFHLKMADSKNFRLKKSDGSDALTVFASGSITAPGAMTIGSGATGLLSSASGFGLNIREGTTTRIQIFGTSGNVAPGADNTQTLGNSSFRWSQLYAGTATINTSDERVKREIEAIEELVLDAWADVQWCQFRFIDGRRLHFGLIAQRVQEALEAHGLDAFELGLLCYDTWEDQYEEVYEEREVLTPIYDEGGQEIDQIVEIDVVPTGKKHLVMEAGDRYGLRYEECFAVEMAYQRRRLDRLEARK